MALVPVFRQIADGALLARYPAETSDREANHSAVALGRAAGALAGVLEAIPGARSILVLFDEARVSGDALTRSLSENGADAGAGARVPARRLTIPVLYGGEAGSDLTELARARGVSEEGFASRHAAAEYEVAFLGFSPGFGYLTGLPEDLHCPRLSTPRTRVPAGSVAIGGPYTGIYPEESPGGWRLIGRAPVRLFDPAAEPPALLSPGDAVRFGPIGKKEFDRELARLPPRSARRDVAEGTPILRIESAGVWTTVQAAPRHGFSLWGVPPGGALDLESLAAGNAAVGNDPWEAALEISLAGPEVEVLYPLVAVVSGGRILPERNGRPIAGDGPFPLERGDRLRIGPVSGSARAYLCVAGGIAASTGATPSVRLFGGEVLCAPGRIADPVPARPVQPIVSASPAQPTVVRVVLGPDEDRFSTEGVATFLSSPYRVSPASDRRGIRLEGPAVSHSGPADVAPEATPLGGVQVARDGQPIVLGPDRPVTGGYARIATVIGADFPLVARALPGSTLRFRSVRISEAVQARSKLPAFPAARQFPSRKEKA